MSEQISYGQLGYEAYCEERIRQGAKEPFLRWDELHHDVQRAWRAAGIRINTRREAERRSSGV